MALGVASRSILRGAIALAVACALAPHDVRAAEPGAELTISLLTFGPGDHPFYKFGHDAILVHDGRQHRDDVYNYGTFDYRSPTLIGDFLKGRLTYWLSVQALAATIDEYRAENRTILAQELALLPAERRALADRLARDALPENRKYQYDYYYNNCATRVRDAIDAAVGGRLRAASGGPASLTFRGHTQRLTADDLGVYLGLDVAMGDAIDQPISQWEEMFLPTKVAERLRYVTVFRSEGEAPLVARETLLLAASRPPPRETPPRWAGRMALAGVVVGAFVAALGAAARFAKRSGLARIAFGLTLAVLGATAGVLGCIFLFLGGATDHYVAHRNENVLQCAPVGLALAVSGVALAWGKDASRAVAVTTAAMAACSLGGLVLKTLPSFDQGNGPIIALLLPVWLGAAAGAWRGSWPRSLTRPWPRPRRFLPARPS